MSTTRRRGRALASACAALTVTSAPADAFAQQLPNSLVTDPLAPLTADLPAKVRAKKHPHQHKRTPQHRLRITAAGKALVPGNAPWRVRRLVRAANRINRTPYVWGGGHGSWHAGGYDCSGSVSFVLHAAGVLGTPLASGGLASYGRPGKGRWVTIYANGGHAYVVVAGRRFDTTAFKSEGTRWSRSLRDNGGYTIRHPPGL